MHCIFWGADNACRACLTNCIFIGATVSNSPTYITPSPPRYPEQLVSTYFLNSKDLRSASRSGSSRHRTMAIYVSICINHWPCTAPRRGLFTQSGTKKRISLIWITRNLDRDPRGLSILSMHPLSIPVDSHATALGATMTS